MYEEQTATCPWCNQPGCRADWCDVGVGMVQCGPFVCPKCHATSIGAHDSIAPTDEEAKVGWYKPGYIDPVVNTFRGHVVDHKTAKELYRAGLLDCKESSSRERETI